MTPRGAPALLALALSGCASDAPPGTLPAPPAASPSPDASPSLPVRANCTDRTAPASIPAGASVAVLATHERELTLFLVEDLSGCWIPLDPSEAPTKLSALAVHPGRRFVFASGEVAPGKAGVAAYAIVPERAALDGLGASWMEEHWFDRAGSLAVTEESVYMISGGPSTGYHGGLWRWAFDAGDGGLTWRGSPSPSRDPFFLVRGADGGVVYLGTEVWDPTFHRAAMALRVGTRGTLTQVSDTTIEAPASAVVDPTGTFVWLVRGWSRDSMRLDAYRPAANGDLGRPESADWARRLPVVHPSGGVLYTASSTHVEAYAVDPQRGTPRLVAQVPYPGGDLQPLAVNPGGRFLYAVSPEQVHAFRTEADGRLLEYGRVAPGGTRLVLTRVPD